MRSKSKRRVSRRRSRRVSKRVSKRRRRRVSKSRKRVSNRSRRVYNKRNSKKSKRRVHKRKNRLRPKDGLQFIQTGGPKMKRKNPKGQYKPYDDSSVPGARHLADERLAREEREEREREVRERAELFDEIVKLIQIKDQGVPVINEFLNKWTQMDESIYILIDHLGGEVMVFPKFAEQLNTLQNYAAAALKHDVREGEYDTEDAINLFLNHPIWTASRGDFGKYYWQGEGQGGVTLLAALSDNISSIKRLTPLLCSLTKNV